MKQFLLAALGTTRPDGSPAIAFLQGQLEALAEDCGAEVQTDAMNNLWCDLGGTTVYTAHLDTVSPREQKVNLQYADGILRSDGNAVMGADDGAGIAILAGMMAAGKPGLYLFAQGEESGGHGAKHAAKVQTSRLMRYSRAVAFDRKGTVDICGSQCVGTLASDEFVDTLADQLGMGHKWADGLYTDNAEFSGLIPEIVNIACGYENNHSKNETLDVGYLLKLFDRCIAIDWDALPTVGVPEEHYGNVRELGHGFYDTSYDMQAIVEDTARALCIPENSFDFNVLKNALMDAHELGQVHDGSRVTLDEEPVRHGRE
jgi:hypothetical protein